MYKIKELGGIELLLHPPYSPDLAPSDYYLFVSMVYFRGLHFFMDFKIKINVKGYGFIYFKHRYGISWQNILTEKLSPNPVRWF